MGFTYKVDLIMFKKKLNIAQLGLRLELVLMLVCEKQQNS